MKFTDFKVSPSEYAGRDVSSLPDRPAISAAELKARFDSPAKVVLGGKYNKFLDALSVEVEELWQAIENIDGFDTYSEIKDLWQAIENIESSSSPDNKNPTIDLPVANGENLQTPCVVIPCSDGVRTPKCNSLRGTGSFYQMMLPSVSNSLFGTNISPLFGNFAVVAYNKFENSAYSPCVSIAKIDNGIITELLQIHAGPSSNTANSTKKIVIKLHQFSENKWFIGLCEPDSTRNYIYAFSFDGDTYTEIAKYEGVANATFAESKFFFLSDNSMLLKYYLSPNTMGVIVKFTGSSFIAGTPVVLNAGLADYPMNRLSTDRVVFKTANAKFRTADINDLEIIPGTNITHTSTVAGFAPLSRNRFGIFYMEAGTPNILFAFANVSAEGEITVEAPQVAGSSGGTTPTITELPDGNIQVLSNLVNMGANQFRTAAVFKVSNEDIERVSTSPWPRFTTLTTEEQYPDNLIPNATPYVLGSVSNTNKTAMVNGMVVCGTYLEPVHAAGIALSVDKGVAKVQMTPGAVKGFSGLKPGTVYSPSFNGQLCDAGGHPLAECIGTAIDEETLWFSGAK